MPYFLNNNEILDLKRGLDTPTSFFMGSTQLSNVVSFSPLDLNPTVWFRASDASNIFSADYPSVNATLNSTVSLVLGIESGVDLSNELLVNGTFDDGLQNWSVGTDGAGWSAVSGRAYFNDTERISNQGLGQQFNTLSGFAHRLSFDYQVVAGQISFSIAAGANLFQRFLSGTGTRSGYLFLTSNTPTFGVGPENVNALVQAYVDNISIRRYPSRFARQTTAANRPFYREDENRIRYFENMGDDTLNWTAPSGTYTIAYLQPNGTITILENQVLNGSANIMLAPQIVQYIAINRTLTTTERTSLTNYLRAITDPPGTFVINNGVWNPQGIWLNSATWSNN